ncbi:MAG: hypothetical protein A07HN63_00678, partial [uncultured archaeon A07HN63]
MSQGSDSNQPVTVSNDGINIEKSVTADEFPVPAVKFVLTSNAASPVRIRLTDQIPESFPMERVGFHPDFHSDSWTAYKNHRVEFEQELDSGESLTTVYGIRTDDEEELQQFLGEPEVTEIAPTDGEDPNLEGVLGPDNSQLIREVLSGERSSLPGSEAGPLDGPVDPSDTDLSPEEAHTPPSETDDAAGSATADAEEPSTGESTEGPEPTPDTDAEPATAEPAADTAPSESTPDESVASDPDTTSDEPADDDEMETTASPSTDVESAADSDTGEAAADADIGDIEDDVDADDDADWSPETGPDAPSETDDADWTSETGSEPDEEPDESADWSPETGPDAETEADEDGITDTEAEADEAAATETDDSDAAV